MKKFIALILCLFVAVVFAKPPTTTIGIVVASEPAIVVSNVNSQPSEKCLDQAVNCGVSNSSVIQDNLNVSNTAGGLTQNSIKLGLVDNLKISHYPTQNNTGGMAIFAPIVGFGGNNFNEVIQLQTSVNIAEGILRNGVGVVSTKTNAPMMVINSLKISGLMNDVTYASNYNNSFDGGYVATAVGVKIRSHTSTMASSCNYLTAAAVTNSTKMAVTQQDKADNTTTATISGSTVMNSTTNEQMSMEVYNSITGNNSYYSNPIVINSRSGKFETSLSYLNSTAGTTNPC